MTALTFPLDQGPLPPAPNVIHGWLITSPYGPRGGGFHPGGDLAFGGCTGQPIRNVAPTLVNQMWDSSGGGNWTATFLDDGSLWAFGHASIFDDPDGPGPARNWNGRRAPQGEVLAYVGTTGGSTGPHLHVAYRAPGARSYSDPLPLLRQMKLWTPSQPDPAPVPYPPKVARMVFTKYPAKAEHFERVPAVGGSHFVYVGDGGQVLDGVTIPLATGHNWIDREWEDARDHGRIHNAPPGFQP